jgi:hypothetical protein
MRSSRVVHDMRDRKTRQLEDLANEVSDVYDTSSSVGTGGYLGLCAAKHHLQLTGAPVDSAVAEKDKEPGVRAVELPRGVREDHQAVHRLDV